MRSAASVSVGWDVPALTAAAAAVALDARRSLKALIGLLKDLERVSVISGESASALAPLSLGMLTIVAVLFDRLVVLLDLEVCVMML